MARYRKIDPRIWNDKKFRELSDASKLAFFLLLTHPAMTAIGAMRATIAGLAAEMKWEEEAFREAFAEISRKGMAEHDPKASFMALPKFLTYNAPESPNVVKGWISAIDLIPECSLRDVHFQRVKAFIKGLPNSFQEGLPEAFRKSMPNQEQEQEQELKAKPPISPQEPNGHDLLGEKPTRKQPKAKREGLTFAAWMNSLPDGEMAIKPTDSVFGYADNAGIPRGYLRLAWIAFEAQMTERKILKKDWPAHFRNAVKADWFKLWRFSATGECYLTTAGKQLEANSQEAQA